ncbi:stage II sporulation protein E [Lutispora thermophila]|uniref:Stage II sporulation protein E n=1 Tax=Lutispora thermophila DSM 19022 TaxID=1122184 RepID=A0A1M6GFD5_9FIRM|nr:stage II sporulation protein E [Lutispora thermophila]SHJ08591.1 stage II sporulation protein E [Lutispora thermophila DSM 19022]
MADLIAIGKKAIPKVKLMNQYSGLIVSVTAALIGFSMGRIVILEYLNPFSIALLCAAMISKLNPYIIGFSIIAGSFSIKTPELLLKNMILVSLMLFAYLIISRTRLNNRVFFSIFAPLANLITGIFIFYFKYYYLYDMFMMIIESVMLCALINIYDKALDLIACIKRRNKISSEEIVSILLLIISSFLGASVYIWQLSIKNIVSIVLILLASFMGNIGTGAAAGIVFGMLQSLSGDIYPSAIGVYGICGLLSSAFKSYGRIMTILGFIIGNSVMTFYINGSTEVLIKIEEILAASIIFMFIPEKKVKNILLNKWRIETESTKIGEAYRLKDFTVERLQEISDVFKELAMSMNVGLGSKEYFSQLDAAEIMEKVVRDTCCKCGMYSSCWKQEFYGTYQKMFSALSKIERGDFNEDDRRHRIVDKCLFPEKIWDRLKYHYDIYRYTLTWKKKIDSGRYALSHQLQETAKLIGGLANKFNVNIEFDKNLEEEIMVTMDKIGIHLDHVSAVKGKDSIEIDMRFRNCGGKRECVSKIIPEIRKITGKHFIKADASCCVTGRDGCLLKLREVHKFSIVTGIARKQKQTSSVSGDNYSLLELKDGKFYMILSDGMGSGPRAAMESGMAVSLIEKFLAAGYDQNTALEAVNSLLLIKSDDDNYATVDMTIINQYTGDVEFLKVGAVSTFIKYKDRVDVIRNSSLPAGILDKIDVEFNRRKIGDGDFVVMITDGVLEANEKDLDKEKWLEDMIYNIDTRNPKKMADIIMEKCLEKSKGQTPDDMTVLVAKIWKSA